jgi:hypothetical protein
MTMMVWYPDQFRTKTFTLICWVRRMKELKPPGSPKDASLHQGVSFVTPRFLEAREDDSNHIKTVSSEALLST